MNNLWWKTPDDLDSKQKSILELPIDNSHLILGPPGSGKTNLLLLRASQLVLSGKQNILILVFTRTLREFVATGGHQYAFGADRICTLNSWAFDFLREQGLDPFRHADFEKQRKGQLDQIQKAIRSRNLNAQYDAIILDEAQDYLAEELDVFFKLGNVVFAAADSRQQVYTTGETGGASLSARFGESIYTLKHHYRNGHKICQVADELAKSWGGYDLLMPTSNYDERRFPSSVTVTSSGDLEGQVHNAIKAIELQMKAYPEEELAILCPKSVLKRVWHVVSNSVIGPSAILQSAEDGYAPFEDGKPICVCSVHGAKGLEFRTVHLIDAENIGKSPLRRNITYTAVTRAKTSLGIYHSKSLPPYLDSALNVIRPPVAAVKLDQLFGKQ